MIKLLCVFFVLFITGCVSTIPLSEQVPTPHYTPKDALIISVVDNRKSVKEGKSKSYVGFAHGIFGIPTDCEIDPWLSVEDSDEKKDLTKFIQYRVATGLKSKGWKINEVNLTDIPNSIEANTLIAQNNAKNLLILKINEWEFNLNLMAVGSFDLNTNTDVIVYTKETKQVFRKNITENDDIELKGDDSHRNQILRAYREQLNQIVNDLSLQQVLQNPTLKTSAINPERVQITLPVVTTEKIITETKTASPIIATKKTTEKSQTSLNQIQKIQTALQAKDYYSGEINGTLDRQTAAAISLYKEAHDLPGDSIDKSLLRSLGIE